jgi:hypothetical protein
MLIVLSYQLSVSWISSKIYSKCNQFLADKWFRTVDYQLENYRYTLSVCESGL